MSAPRGNLEAQGPECPMALARGLVSEVVVVLLVVGRVNLLVIHRQCSPNAGLHGLSCRFSQSVRPGIIELLFGDRSINDRW